MFRKQETNLLPCTLRELFMFQLLSAALVGKLCSSDSHYASSQVLHIRKAWVRKERHKFQKWRATDISTC
jgi:hypothetical protein